MKELKTFKEFLKKEKSLEEAWSLNSAQITRDLEYLSQKADSIARNSNLKDNTDLIKFAEDVYYYVEQIKRAL
jgi:hypothetical protein